jgi:poly-beta-hydroxybutyrate-responsive repressor
MGFIQPCLLVMLHRGNAHGYSLSSGLDEFGFNSEGLDSSIIYRALRDMEIEGLVESHWDDESMGPQRRVYSITQLGEDQLTKWVDDLRSTQEAINALLKAYGEVKEE